MLTWIEFLVTHSNTWKHLTLLTSSSSSCRAASTDIPDPLAPFSLSFIASGRSPDLHPVSSPSCCMYVLDGRPAFARPYVGVHRSTSLMSSSLLLQQYPACLVRLAWRVFVMGGRWPGRIVGALWGVAARTYSILLATFLCNCRLASSPVSV